MGWHRFLFSLNFAHKKEMQDVKQPPLDFVGGKATSLVPFGIFIVSAIVMSIFNNVSIQLLLLVGVASLVFGMFLAKNKASYWSTVLDGMGSHPAMTATVLWLIVGVYGNILKEGDIVEGLVWACAKLDIGAAGYAAITFLFSSLFAVATGSGFGTITTMSLILYPVGVAVGASPAIIAGAILSGAAFGDNIAPVSDTTLIAATTQEYSGSGEVADIAGCVRSRLRYVIPAGAIALALFIAAGTFWHDAGIIDNGPLSVESANPNGLYMLLPTILVIILSFLKIDIFASLAIGTIVAVALGYALNLFAPHSLLWLGAQGCGGSVIDGITSMSPICLLLCVVVGMSSLLLKSGCMDSLLETLSLKLLKTKREADIAIFSFASIAGILIAAINTIANICVAPFINSIGKRFDLHPYRRSDILATVICTFPFILPYGGCVLLLLKGIEIGCQPYPTFPKLQATDVFLTAFYCWVIWFVMLFSCLTGKGRRDE